jgi:hypothetical protein
MSFLHVEQSKLLLDQAAGILQLQLYCTKSIRSNMCHSYQARSLSLGKSILVWTCQHVSLL